MSKHDFHFIQPCPSEGKKKKNCLLSPEYEQKSHPKEAYTKPVTQPYTARAETKRKEELDMKA